jgi:hypothetical protein
MKSCADELLLYSNLYFVIASIAECMDVCMKFTDINLGQRAGEMGMVAAPAPPPLCFLSR